MTQNGIISLIIEFVCGNMIGHSLQPGSGSDLAEWLNKLIKETQEPHSSLYRRKTCFHLNTLFSLTESLTLEHFLCDTAARLQA